MQSDIKTFFENKIIPLITEKYPRVASEMSIQIQGSYGLGIADEYSDLDVIIWLDDLLWKEQGGQVQLLLEHIPKFAKSVSHCEISVWPLSWLGYRKEFLQDKADLPWENVKFEELYELQNNSVLRDPNNIFQTLKVATSPERFPTWLWKKQLIIKFKKFLCDDFSELNLTTRRDRTSEAQIIFGCVLEDLFHLGFLINKQYYPWRTHLRWAFQKLPNPISQVLSDIDVVTSSPDWNKKLASIKVIVEIYRRYIAEKNILSEIDILSPELTQELIWAERLKAWSKPDWRKWIADCQDKAKTKGNEPGDFWIWSLWHWD